MTARPFKILGIQQIAIGAEDRTSLRKLWVDLLGFTPETTFQSESENVDEEILRLEGGLHELEIDLMQPLDLNRKPRVDLPPLNHVGLWVSDLEQAVQWLSERGVRIAPGGIRQGASGHPVCFIHPRGSDEFPIGGSGVLIELVQTPHHDTWRPMLDAPKKIRTLGCHVDPLSMSEATSLLKRWLDELNSNRASSEPLPPCRFVVTPNLDHAVLLKESSALRDAYSDAALVLADGMPLVWTSRLFRRPLPERVTGSDLTPNLLRIASPGTRVFFLGAREESSLLAVKHVAEQYPQLNIVGRLSPPLGFEKSLEWSDKIVQQIQESQANLILIGLGAPKQELWIHAHHKRLPGTVALCVGATIDFLAGTVNRAPDWAQRVGAEWIHRLLSDPKRLARRYYKDAVSLPGLLLDDIKAARQSQ